jgi:hypothetical protein
LALDAIDWAKSWGGDIAVIYDAQEALAEGDMFRSSGQFKDAINKYKDALAKALSVG